MGLSAGEKEGVLQRRPFEAFEPLSLKKKKCCLLLPVIGRWPSIFRPILNRLAAKWLADFIRRHKQERGVTAPFT
jgi:hypothetical protein